MVRPRADAGSTAASSPKSVVTALTNEPPPTISDTAGPSLGLTTFAFFTTARQLVQMVNRGRSARNLSGGMKQRVNGLDSTLPTSTRTSVLITNRQTTP